MEAKVYWLHLKNHNDIFSEGYVGVSTDPDKRFKRHLYKANTGTHDNPHLINAIIKSGNSIFQDVVAAGTEEYCYKIEAKLRPKKDIGWNIAEGGGRPPYSGGRPSGFKGKKHTEEEKQRRRERYSGEGNPFFGKKHTAESKIAAGAVHIGVLPPNATKVRYKGAIYQSLAEASKKVGVSIYYIQKEAEVL